MFSFSASFSLAYKLVSAVEIDQNKNYFSQKVTLRKPKLVLPAWW